MFNPLTEDNCVICPRAKDAKQVAGWILWGTARGFALKEGHTMLFDGYGNTHHTAVVQLGIGREVQDTFIFTPDGRIQSEAIHNSKVLRPDEFFLPEEHEFFRALEKELRVMMWVVQMGSDP